MGQAAIKKHKYEWLTMVEIERKYNLTRTTLSKRLYAAGIGPIEDRGNKKFFEITPEFEIAIHKQPEGLSEVKLRKETADAELREAKVALIRKDLVPMGDVIELMQSTLTAHYKEFSLRQPKRLASRLVKAKTIAEVAKIMKADTDKIFTRLRESDGVLVPEIKVKKS